MSAAPVARPPRTGSSAARSTWHRRRHPRRRTRRREGFAGTARIHDVEYRLSKYHNRP
ncbi:hypothetical protein NKG05_00820 [Oerskovia sp. M15]